MPTYASITFGVEMTRQRFIPLFAREQLVSVEHIPGSDEDDVQFGGLAYGKLKFRAQCDTYADYLALVAARGTTRRTLTYNARSFTNVLLLQVGAAEEHAEHSGLITADLEFMQVS